MGNNSMSMIDGLTEACQLDALTRGILLVAVSGGGDSIGLLHALHYGGVLPLATGAREIVVVHADHGLRPQSSADRTFVEKTCEKFGLRCVAEKIAVCSHAGEGIEAAARRARYAHFSSTAGVVGARVVLLAHTLDDQAETVLHRLCRGTGVNGLGGMSSVRELVEGITLVRPMLTVPRSSVRRYLESVGQSWVEDASNEDVSRSRNYLRHKILPSLEQGPYPGAAAAICRLADHARRMGRLVTTAAAAVVEQHATLNPESAVVDLSGLQVVDPDLLVEAFVEIWRRQAWPRRDMTTTHYRRLAETTLRLSKAAARQEFQKAEAFVLPGGVRVTHETHPMSPGRLVLRRVVALGRNTDGVADTHVSGVTR